MSSMLISFRNPLANFLLALLPATSCFGFKRYLLNLLGFHIGQGCKITGGVKFYGHGNVTIGSNTWVGLGCVFVTAPDASISIGSNCDIAPYVLFHTGSHHIGGPIRRAGVGFSLPIKIDEGSWVGTRSLILGGAHLGASSILAASGVLLSGEHPSNTLFVGQPAKAKRPL